MPRILIVGELNDGAPSPVTGQLIAAARKAYPDATVAAAFLGDDLSSGDAALGALPVDDVYLLEHPRLAGGDAGVFDAPVSALAALCRETDPETVLMARTDLGAAVGPRLAFRLGVTVAQDCIDMAVNPDTGRLAVTRPVYGGSAMAVFEFGSVSPQVVLVRPGAFESSVTDGGSARVQKFDTESVVSEPRTRLIDSVSEPRTGVRLEDAEVVVSGGRGLGGPEPFQQLEELASLLGGAVGASRAACDAGWMDHSFQVGLTGKSISPRLYITVGISGASQHMAGCSSARNIVAINKDGEANIFKEARYGVVGDWQKILPAFIATVRDLSGS